MNKDTPLINSNLNESNSVDLTNKTDGTVFNNLVIILSMFDLNNVLH